MKSLSKVGLALCALLLAGQASADITFFEHEGFGGRSFTAAGDRPVRNLKSQGFNDRASSVIVTGNRSERWEVCDDHNFRGRCIVLRPGQYTSLAAMDLNDRITSLRSIPVNQRVADTRYAPIPAGPSKIEFFAREGFEGRSFSADKALPDFRNSRFNDRASSIIVTGGSWEVCAEPGYAGRCAQLRPGKYPSLATFGFGDQVSSARAIAHASAPPPAPANQIVFFENEGLRGGSVAATAGIADFRGTGLNNRSSSVVVTGVPWEVCQGTGYSGRCVVLKSGQYASLAAMGLDDRISSARIFVAPQAPLPTASQVTFYESEGYQGRSYTSDTALDDMRRAGFNDRASSIVVRGNQTWEVCEHLGYTGRCVLLRPGDYPTLNAMGMNNNITSLRAVATGADSRPRPVMGDYRRRDNERLFQANVTRTRAVVADAGQRCWVDREQVNTGRSDPNVQGAVLGAVIGGVLGHQVGGGSGRDVATGLGVLVGAALGANAGRGEVVQTQDVQHCRDAPKDARPAYYDVTYTFRGQEYRAQMSEDPGATIVVNDRGEPRE